MGIIEHARALHFSRLSVELTELPGLLKQHIRSDPDTEAIEGIAKATRSGGFNPQQTAGFIRKVCAWGGYAGVAGRVLKGNDSDELCRLMAGASSAAEGDDVCGGLTLLLDVKGFAVSFASKHLKFLVPERAVVLDSIISSRLGYPMTVSGYREFLADCQTILQAARQARVRYPGWGPDGWRVSDIEMAIFSKLKA